MRKTLNEVMGTVEDAIGSSRGGATHDGSTVRSSFGETSSESLRLAILRTLAELRRETEEHGDAADESAETEHTVGGGLGDGVGAVRADRASDVAVASAR